MCILQKSLILLQKIKSILYIYCEKKLFSIQRPQQNDQNSEIPFFEFSYSGFSGFKNTCLYFLLSSVCIS